MPLTFKIVKINPDYCDYLRKYDNKVYINSNNKITRPFVGILFLIDNMEYYAPLSSPKPKHKKMSNTIDFLKLDNGNLGAINFNNMIPVTKNNYVLENLQKTNFSSIQEAKYINLEKQQLKWLNSSYYQVKNKAKKLYKLFKQNKLNTNIRKRCCNFSLLEEKCKEWKEVQNLLTSLQYIKDANDLFYIYDELACKNNFEKVVRILDNSTDCFNIINININNIENKI